MLNLVYAEFYKLWKSLSLKICFLLSCISAGALVYITHGITVGSISTDITGSASGLTEIVIVSLLGSLMAGIIVCSDFETKTIHDSVACGNGRITIVLSKTFVYFLVMALLLLPYLVATLVGLLSGAEFKSPFVASVFLRLLTDAAGRTVTVGLVGKVVAISLVAVLVNAARLSICIPLAFKIRKPVAVLAIGFIYNALIDLFIGLLKDVPIVKDILQLTPYSKDFLLVTVNTPTGTLIRAVIYSIVFLGLMAAVAYAIFRRAEIK